jgi:heterodisulfide reductase subunit B
LCQFNLDAYHAQVEADYGPVVRPTVYFTQLMGLAFGLPEGELGLRRAAVALTWRPTTPGALPAPPVHARAAGASA